MKAHRFPVWLLAAALGAASFTCPAAEPEKPVSPAPAPAVKPTPATANAAKNAQPAKAPEPVKPPDDAKLRATISKALAFLGKEGDEWITDKNCNGCHHMPELIWSHHAAKRRGFPVDQAKFDEWLKWADEKAPKKAGGNEELGLMVLAMPERPMPAFTKIIARDQKADGTWDAGGQFTGMQARGPKDAVDNSMRMFLLALAAQPASKAECDAALTKASAKLEKPEPAKTVESLVFRSLFADRFGKPADATAARAEILKLQRGDGGWSYNIGANQSDPLATGQALYILQPSSDPKSADAIARAQNWLVSIQRENGSFPIDYSHISKVDRSDPKKSNSVKNITMIYTFWGSSWATIGLLQGVPVTPQPTVTAK